MGGHNTSKWVKKDPCGENEVTGTASWNATQAVWGWGYVGPKPVPAGPAFPNPPAPLAPADLQDLNNQAFIGAQTYAQTAMDEISKDQCKGGPCKDEVYRHKELIPSVRTKPPEINIRGRHDRPVPSARSDESLRASCNDLCEV